MTVVSLSVYIMNIERETEMSRQHTEAIAALIVLDAQAPPVYAYQRGVAVHGWGPTGLSARLRHHPDFDRAELIRAVETRPRTRSGTGPRCQNFAVKVTAQMRRDIVAICAASGVVLHPQRGGWFRLLKGAQ